MAQKKRIHKTSPAKEKALKGIKQISKHVMFAPLMFEAWDYNIEELSGHHKSFAVVSIEGAIYVNYEKPASVEEWVYILAHSLLHLGLGHFQEKPRQDLWNIACDVFVAKFLYDVKIGITPIPSLEIFHEIPLTSEERLYQHFLEHGVDKRFVAFSTAEPGKPDMIFTREAQRWFPGGSPPDWQKLFGMGLRDALTSAVNIAGGQLNSLTSSQYTNTPAMRAKNWFISSYPLLGSLAAGFEIIEDIALCRSMDIAIAAVHPELKEIYINPLVKLNDEECKFVMAHELLHVGLRHDTRAMGRDPYLWNIACDYVINGWLVEMQIGELPEFGALYDPKLKGESAESVYDTITKDLRLLRKLQTFRGIGKGDILEPRTPAWWCRGKEGTDLDSFYRRCLMQGLEFHLSEGRGFLSAGLIEEVKALAQPPISWDVELAKWFDGLFKPLEKVRSYARPSRRQSGSPDIPRPKYVTLSHEDARTFAVLLDTSGSMNRTLLAKALGAITSYSLSRDVSRVRLVFCDAATYDQGYVAPEDLVERVKIKGRGGTVLQPGINLLQTADDFPKEGPILIITDGGCDVLKIKREHAFLMPAYASLPFAPKGKVFRVE